MKILVTAIILAFSTTTIYADFMPRFDTANIREEAYIDAKVVDVVARDTVLKDLEIMRNGENNRVWHYVETHKGIKGYVASDVIKPFELRDIKLPIDKTETVAEKNNHTVVISNKDKLHRINISLKNLNRLTCGAKISDPIYSKDKEFEIVRGGDKDLFIKISPVRIVTNGVVEIKFNTFERELFVECLGNIYNFTLIPIDNLPTQTIVIKSIFHEIQQARNIERISDYEELLYKLIQNAYLEQIPTGYQMKKGNLAYEFEELEMKLRYVYKGYDYIVEDWEIISRSASVIELDESSFIPYIKSARAVTFVSPRLVKNDKTRMLVVRLNSD